MKTKRRFLLIICLLAVVRLSAQTGLNYYLPQGARLNPSIPTPQSVIGFEIGEYHLTYANLLRYMEALDQASDRITLVKIGQTWEKQPLVQLIITSPVNQQNLEKLRRDHLAALDPANSSNPGRKDPLVVWLGIASTATNRPVRMPRRLWLITSQRVKMKGLFRCLTRRSSYWIPA